ncbi:hypothetical protein K435DRAFT_859195 [Dendrothele bispora CBS 962.96]|uniref:CCHC-type domain-containing protein n=1 Tax=Dendrothele bispora (strain CBS 962.96) TaxID=1314807 RepID=A0A4S8M1G8_DENBC|nr:hypothetical protein K435DRAFT_859195 [Dendrothele bispora CBS 962.96]
MSTSTLNTSDRPRTAASNSTRGAVAKTAQEEPSPKVPTFRISREERDRRMNEGLCIRCGGRGHFGKECKTHHHTEVGKSCFALEQAEEEEPEEILYAIDANGDFHQIDEEEEHENCDHSSCTNPEPEQGNKEGARDLKEGEK